MDFGYAKATGDSIQMALPRSASFPEMEMEWKVPEKSNAIERDRARTYHQAYSALIALHNLERAMKEVQARSRSIAFDFSGTIHSSSISGMFGDRGRTICSELPVALT